MKDELTPREVVEQLDRFIVGQDKAKRAVAIAIRNRIRRQWIEDDLRDEVIPKNILMIGPTGVGKTEIARRMATLVKAPFLKIEASKFTETGYVGRDVESIVRDLIEIGYRMVEREAFEAVEEEARRRADERLLDILAPPVAPVSSGTPSFGGFLKSTSDDTVVPDPAQQAARAEMENKQREQAERVRNFTRQRLLAGELENQEIEFEVEQSQMQNMQIFGAAGMEEMGFDMADMLGNFFPKQKSVKRTTVADARPVLMQEEAEQLVDTAAITREAVDRVENNAIVFLDELDKIAGREGGHGPDVSREGVQRDILPIVEGSTVMTKHGPVSTDHVLFIAAGAFHVNKPSDLIPELQGRFPIRVELDSLTRDDLKRILYEPENSLIKQYTALLGTEEVEVKFTDGAIDRLADLSARVNDQSENIGARRLHTLVEKLLEELSFVAPEISGQHITIDEDYVDKQLVGIVDDTDLSRYML